MSGVTISIVGAEAYETWVDVYVADGPKLKEESLGQDRHDVVFSDPNNPGLIDVVIYFKVPTYAAKGFPVFKQRFGYAAAGGGKLGGYYPVSSRTSQVYSGPELRGPGRHPRFVEQSRTQITGSTDTIVKIKVDCVFLPMTAQARAMDDSDNGGRCEGFDPLRAGSSSSLMRALFYEYTHASAGQIWMVAYNQQRATSTRKLHGLIFFMPKGRDYSNIRDLGRDKLYTVRRYLLSPSDVYPFFVRNDGGNSGRPDWPSSVTDCGFIEQLYCSGKSVMLALPIPKVAAAPINDNPRDLLLSLRRAVHSDEIGDAVEDFSPPFRVAVGGFSGGTDAAQSSLKSFGRSIDEFYSFEPNDPNYVNKQKQWVAGSQTRRLRLVSTTRRNQAPFNSLPDLSPPMTSERATVMPEQGYRASAVYQAAVGAVPARGTSPGRDPEPLSPVSTSGAPAGTISGDSGIYLRSSTFTGGLPTTAVQGRDAGNREVQPSVSYPCTPGEIAGKARFGMLNDRSGNYGERLYATKNIRLIGGPNPFSTLVETIVGSTGGSLHQWAVAGGMRADNQVLASRSDAGFYGFLQLCLQNGDYP